MDFDGAKNHILSRLTESLSPNLFYHCVAHTKSVWESAVRLARMENLPGNQIKLLETAALFHDSGMLIQYHDHETNSVKLSREILTEYGYTLTEIDAVGELILTTRLPQSARTLAEEILCDADLDYLGREDFFIHSFELQLEWKLYGIKNTNLQEWMFIQEDFLTHHQYFTKSSIQLRQTQKKKNLREITEIIHRQ